MVGEGEWRNWSRFALEPRYIPRNGERVTLRLDRQGYIRSITGSEPDALLAVSPSVHDPVASLAAQISGDETATARDDRHKVLLSLMRTAATNAHASPSSDAANIIAIFRALLLEYDAQMACPPRADRRSPRLDRGEDLLRTAVGKADVDDRVDLPF
jgi:hypothetical protein